LIVEVFFAPFRPEVVQNKAPEYVQGLSSERVSTGVVCEQTGGIVVVLRGSFVDERKRPGDLKVAVRLSVAPYALEGVPSFLGHGAFEQAVLRGLLYAQVANFAVGGNVHELQPRPHREALVEGEPYEGAHFPGPGVLPDPSDDLIDGRVPQVEALNEGYHMRGAREAPGVDVTSLRSISEERSVP